MPKTRLTIPTLAAAALLALPAAGTAATRFGSRLVDDPNSSGCATALCTLVAFTQPSAPNGDLSSAGAPMDGVITVLRIREQTATAATVTFRLANVVPSTTQNLATAAGTGPTVPIPAGTDPQTLAFPARLPVKAGQHLALDNTSVNVIHDNNGSPFTYVYDSPLIDGEGARGANSVADELLVQADIEPDADHDGFGDETQDSCPSQAAVHVGPCAPPPPHPPHLVSDTQPPAVHGLSIAGGKIAYALSEAATVGLRIDRAASGRKVHGKCVAPTARNRRSPRCTRFVTLLRSIRAPGKLGSNRLALPKLHGRKLAPGVYRITLTAHDAAGNATITTKQFRIRR